MLSLGTIRWFFRAAGAGLTLAALNSGCTISPKPEPPHPPDQPIFDLGDLTGHLAQHYGAGGFLIGGPGAANPAGALVRAFNLDTTEPSTEATVADDGSFALEILMQKGDEVRLQIVSAELGRSAPVDVIVGDSGSTPTLADRPLEHCLKLQPPLEIDLSVQQTVLVHNQCDQQVSISPPYVRRVIQGFEVGTGGTWPAQLAVNESVSVAVQFSAPGVTLEEIFFITATSPETDRRPLTALPQNP